MTTACFRKSNNKTSKKDIFFIDKENYFLKILIIILNIFVITFMIILVVTFIFNIVTTNKN